MYNMRKYVVMLCVTFSLNIVHTECGSCNSTTILSTSAKLLRDLFCDYDKRVRPTSDPDVPTEVSVGFFPFYIFIDDEWDAIHIAGHTDMVWKDNFLVWNTSKYRSATIRGQYLDVWVPEIISYDQGIKGFFENEDSFVEKFIIVSNTGKVTLNARILLTGYCDMKMHYWPYIEANCTILAGSPNYDADIIYTYKSNLDLQYLRNDTEWQLLNISSFCEWYQSSPDDDKACILTYHIKMAKYTKVYASMVVTPVIVLSILTLVPFWMQYNTVHRLILSLFVFFGQLVYLAMLSLHIEETRSESVLIVTFLRNSLLFSTIGIIVTLIDRAMLLKEDLPPKVFVDFIRFYPSSSIFKVLWFVLVGNDKSELIIVTNEEICSAGKSKTVVHEWKILSCILNRTLFVIFVIFTIFFWIKLIP